MAMTEEMAAIRDSIKKLEERPMTNNNSLDNQAATCSVCPACGYCPCCGRSSPNYWVPYRPAQPWEYVPFQPAPIINPTWPYGSVTVPYGSVTVVNNSNG
jgi:hypothetical protein